MDPNELLKMLDLKAKPPPATDAPSPITPTDTTPREPVESASPTALAVDEWGLRRGRDLVAESERLRKSGADEFAAADFFAAAFDPEPRLTGGCADPRRHQFLAQM